MSSLKLQTSLKQQMILTPQLRQRIEMLQMTSLELSNLVQQELLQNPVLEEVQSDEEIAEISSEIIDQNADGETNAEVLFQGGDSPRDDSDTLPDEDIDVQGEVGSSDSFEEVDFGREFQEYLDPGYKTQEFEVREDGPGFENFVSKSPSLEDHLNWQIGLLSITEALEKGCRLVAGNLDADGRLVATLEDLASEAGVSIESIEQSRSHVMRLEPVGCGAIDVRECLRVQLEELGDNDPALIDLIDNHLQDLQPHRLAHLAKATGLKLEELELLLERIRRLDPFPGRRFSAEAPEYVVPEIGIDLIDGEFVIYFPDDGSPRLRLNGAYQKMASEKGTSKETRDFIREKMRSAIDLLRNIEHRRQTIYRIVECIVRRQREFLERGVEYLKPMMLKDVAEEVGMHLSTISRVVNRKYAHTPQGVIELRRFFSEGMMSEDGEEVSTRILKLKIKKMIEDEDPKKPLTDDQIAKRILADGVRLSRRTVAKYRDQLKIPGSRERKVII